MAEEKNQTKKSVTKIDHFDNWLRGIVNLDIYFNAYIENKLSFKHYKNKIRDYLFSVGFMIILIIISFAAILKDYTNTITFQNVSIGVIICILSFALIKVSGYWKYYITFKTGKIKNKYYKLMKTIDISSLVGKFDLRETIIKLYTATIIVMLYPEVLKDIQKSKEYQILKKSSDKKQFLSEVKNYISDDIYNNLKINYLNIRESSSFLDTLIDNPNILSTIHSIYDNKFNDIELNDKTISFFQYCYGTDDLECICKQKTFNETKLYQYLIGSDLFIYSLCYIYRLNSISISKTGKYIFPDLNERYTKFAAKINYPFVDLYELYRSNLITKFV